MMAENGEVCVLLLKMDDELVGRRCRRFFAGGPVDGTINEWLPPEEKDGVALWRMGHDDGDEEELELYEVLDALEAFERKLTKPEDSSAEEDEESSEDAYGSAAEDESSSSLKAEAEVSTDDSAAPGNVLSRGAERTPKRKRATKRRWSLAEAQRLQVLVDEANSTDGLARGPSTAVLQKIARNLGTGRSVASIRTLVGPHRLDALVKQCAARESNVEVVDGLELLKSKRADSGYKMVESMASGKFMLRVVMDDGRREVLGIFDTAVEAAKRYALYRKDPGLARRASTEDQAAFFQRNELEVARRGLVREAAGMQLFLSPFARSGYRHVYLDQHDEVNPWNVQIELGGEQNASKRLGHFATPVDAAIAVAKYAASHCDEVWHEQRRQYPRVSQSVGAEIGTARARVNEPIVFIKRHRIYKKTRDNTNIRARAGAAAGSSNSIYDRKFHRRIKKEMAEQQAHDGEESHRLMVMPSSPELAPALSSATPPALPCDVFTARRTGARVPKGKRTCGSGDTVEGARVGTVNRMVRSSGLEEEHRPTAWDDAVIATASVASQTLPPRTTCGMGGCALPAYHRGLCLTPAPEGRLRASSLASGPTRPPTPLCAEGSCQICFEHADIAADEQERGRRTRCGHLYHGSCLEQWLRQKAECPVCRAPLFSRTRMWLDACTASTL